jgi:hypothetical protein
MTSEIDLRAELKELEEGGYTDPQPATSGDLMSTKKSRIMFVGSLERLSVDVARRCLDGAMDKSFVGDLKVVGDLLLRIEQTNLAARRLALAEEKQAAKRQAAVPAHSEAPVAAKPDPSSLTSQASSLPTAKPRKRPRDIFDRPRPVALKIAREQLAEDPQYAEYLKAKAEGWRPPPWIEESNKRVAAIQKREAEAEAADPASRTANLIDDDDQSPPTPGELSTAIYEADPGFADYQRDQALSPEEKARIRVKMANWQPRDDDLSPKTSRRVGTSPANT